MSGWLNNFFFFFLPPLSIFRLHVWPCLMPAAGVLWLPQLPHSVIRTAVIINNAGFMDSTLHLVCSEDGRQQELNKSRVFFNSPPHPVAAVVPAKGKPDSFQRRAGSQIFWEFQSGCHSLQSCKLLTQCRTVVYPAAVGDSPQRSDASSVPPVTRNEAYRFFSLLRCVSRCFFFLSSFRYHFQNCSHMSEGILA